MFCTNSSSVQSPISAAVIGCRLPSFTFLLMQISYSGTYNKELQFSLHNSFGTGSCGTADSNVLLSCSETFINFDNYRTLYIYITYAIIRRVYCTVRQAYIGLDHAACPQIHLYILNYETIIAYITNSLTYSIYIYICLIILYLT